MAEILSAQEIEALLVDRPKPPAAAPGIAPKGIVSYSFDDPTPLTPAVLEPLTEAAQRFAVDTGRRLAAALGREISFALLGVEPIGRAGLGAIFADRVRLRFESPESRHAADLVVDTDTALALIEARLGGSAAESQPKRPLTALETRLVAGLTQTAVAPAVAAWLAAEGAAPEPLICRFVPASAEAPSAVLARFQLTLEGRGGTLHLLLAASRALDSVSAAPVAKARTGRGIPAAALAALRVRIMPRIPGGLITLKDLMDLTPGRVVRLDASSNAPVEVLVNGEPSLAGKIVRAESGSALEIVGWTTHEPTLEMT